ncbi:MAG: hypothetical protein QOJ81_419 [Chloroflexota bacterium]|nr:hypothetical protein [Chloroflexota bacterium]
MSDRESQEAVETRLRSLLAGELQRAEREYPNITFRKPQDRAGLSVVTFATLAACLVAALVLLRPSSGVPGAADAIVVGPDGLPSSIGGETVLRRPEMEIRAAQTGEQAPFLAGGYLVLDTVCASVTEGSADVCPESWILADELNASPDQSIDVAEASQLKSFVRTSGAPTVFRVTSLDVTSRHGVRRITAVVEALVWRRPTVGTMPDYVGQTKTGTVNEAFVPDFISVVGGPSGNSIVGYAPKLLLLHPRLLGGSRPQEAPVPVYGPDLTTQVGVLMPGSGFIPLGSSLVSSAPASVGASLQP